MIAPLLLLLLAGQAGTAAAPDRPRGDKAAVERAATDFLKAVRTGAMHAPGPSTLDYQNAYTREHRAIGREALRERLLGCHVARSVSMHFQRTGRWIEAHLHGWACPDRPEKERYLETVLEVVGRQVIVGRVIVWAPSDGKVAVPVPPRRR